MNIKTGLIPVSTSSRNTCPDSCLFKENGCYAHIGPLTIHWNKVTKGERGDSFEDFCKKIKRLRKGQLWRHNQAGDLEGEGDLIDFESLKLLVAANKGKCGFTYTHKPVFVEDIKTKLSVKKKQQIVENNRIAIKFANDNGFTVNLSGNNVEHAKKLRELGIGSVVAAVAQDAKTNQDYVVCPATNQENVSCSTYGLCQKQHKKIVTFPVHGSAKRLAGEVVANF